MTQKLWDRGEPLDGQIERFTVGRDPELDTGLVSFDVLASAAHATMLCRIGVLTEAELAQLLEELRAIHADARANRFEVHQSDEDCHTAIENRLTARLGDVGRKVHTGRSRNDQVIAMMRLYGREIVLAQVEALLELAAELLALADRHRETTVAGYTHTRQAMPSTFGLLFGAHAECLLDDVAWLQTTFRHLNRNPLGSASGYGVALPLDRPLVAQLLAFDSVQTNTLAVQNDRGRTEYLALSVAATVTTDLARLAGDLLWFSSDELRYVGLDPSVTTGSSIMPQKRNPDVLELIRATAASLRSRATEIGAIFGSLSSGYHRDLQLTKAPFVEGMQSALDALVAMRRVLQTLTIDPQRCSEALQRSIGATDAVYQRVAAGEPFRSAYKEVARDPAAAVDGDPADGWRARTHLGAPGAPQPEQQRAAHNVQLSEHWLVERKQRIAVAWKLLED